jgi:uncharacterized repeat protein (TIGR03806 family)
MTRLPASFAGASVGLLLAGLVLGCGGGGGGGGGSDEGPVGLDVRVPVTTLEFPGVGPTTGSVRGVDAFPSLRFSAPVLVTHAPGDATRLFVVEQRGRIRVVEGTGAAATVSTFLDISSIVTQAMGEQGLLGLAFDPGYATNRRFYVNYIATGSPRLTVVARYECSEADPDVADTTGTILFTVEQPFANHNAGMLAFGPDGFLYGSIGDGGSAGDPGNHGLDTTSLLGKIFRIDVRTAGGAGVYAIPTDNPFAGATDGRRREIYAWGLRNPWRFSFDRVSGALWCGDVGQATREEIDVVRLGGNYGWRAMEGTFLHSEDDVDRGPFDEPVFEYGRSQGNCVIGGYVYRGAALPALYGAYVYADHNSGRLWALTWDGSQVVSNVEIGSLPSPSSFGEDAAGELFACDYDGGRILRLEATVAEPTAFPALLSETGIFADLATLTPEAGLVPYEVNAPLWSDHALKDRLVALPGLSAATWSRDDAWTFPVGTCLVKTFRLPLVRGDPTSAVKIETRVLLRTTAGWEGYSYRWRDDGTDADLLPGSDTRVLTVADTAAPGGNVEQTWRFPSRAECLQCHTEAAGRVLGLTTRQLNASFDYGPVGGRVANQVRTWDHLGMLVGFPGDPAMQPAFPSTSDALAPVADRARAYLDANCAMCHRPGGPTGTTIDLRATEPVPALGLVGVEPLRGGLGLPSPLLVAPGDHAASVLWLRMRALDGNRMPSLGSSVGDDEGEGLVAGWIDAGP